jgi:hypothetical protein
MWGLRLLRDPDAFNQGSSQLKPGRADELIAATTARGYKLSATEIRNRLRCARAYPTEAQIQQILVEFETWSALIQADFPAREAPQGEPTADHRTDDERRRDHARALAELVNEQGALFPLSDFEPQETTVKELQEYTREMEDLTARFAERDRKRREYVDRLAAAAEGDLSMTWKEAHDRLGDGTEAGEDPPLDPEDYR